MRSLRSESPLDLPEHVVNCRLPIVNNLLLAQLAALLNIYCPAVPGAAF